MQIKIDFSKMDRKIKPLHGIDNAPVMGIKTDLSHFMGEAGIPYCRFNDMGGMFGGGQLKVGKNLRAYYYALQLWLGRRLLL